MLDILSIRAASWRRWRPVMRMHVAETNIMGEVSTAINAYLSSQEAMDMFEKLFSRIIAPVIASITDRRSVTLNRIIFLRLLSYTDQSCTPGIYTPPLL